MIRHHALTLLLAATGTLVAVPAAANVTWRGDLETGDLSQWSKAESVAGSPVRLLPVTAAEVGAYGVRQGRYALRVTVVQGDDPIHASGNRAEVVRSNRLYHEGDDVYYAWSTLFPSDFGRTSTWQVFTQFHHTGCCGSPPLELDVTNERIAFVSQKENVFDETVMWSTPLVRGVWHDFIAHVTWSSDAAKGAVQLWYDGAEVLPRRHVRTLFSDGSAYLKQGYYRNASIDWTGVIYHDGMVEASSLADVLGAATERDAGRGEDGGAAPPIDASTPRDDAATPEGSPPVGLDASAIGDDAGGMRAPIPAGRDASAHGAVEETSDAARPDDGGGCTTSRRADGAAASWIAALVTAGACAAARRRRRGRC